MAEEMTSQSSRDEGDVEVSTETPIPQSLKFLMNSVKILAQNPLTMDNYHIWSAQIIKLFKANGYSSFLDQQKPRPPKFLPTDTGVFTPNPNYTTWSLIDQNLSAALYAVISQPILPYVLNMDTTAEIWLTLAKRLQSTNRSRVMQLKNELHHVSMKDNNMSQYLAEIKKIVDLLATAGTNIDKEDVILYTLNGLPPNYQSFKMAVRTRLDPIELDDFYALLCSEEINIEAENSRNKITVAVAMQATRNKESKTPYRGRGRNASRGGRNTNSSRNQK